MAEPTIWSKDPHTDAKHRILEEYLKAWFPIISRYYEKVIFIDGFAGPGVYEEGKVGSPIIALQCLMNHSLELCQQRDTKFVFLFIESNAERAEKLNKVIASTVPEKPESVTVSVMHGEFNSTMSSLLDLIETNQKNLDPTFAFIDPFGYSGLPFNLIKRILNYEHCEVFINFAYDSVNRFIKTDDSRQQLFSDLFGTDEWQDIRGIKDPDRRNRELTALYTKQLQTCARYVRSFEMINEMNKISYYLYFATNQIKGFEEMKRAMWKVDPRGSFRFADTTDAGTKFLLSFGKDTKFDEQADQLFSHFNGQTTGKLPVERFCSENTAFPTLWSTSLKILEDAGKLTIQTEGKRRKGTFPAGCVLRFNNQ